MFFARAIVVSCAAIIVTGCTMIPRYERPVAPVAARFPGASGSQAVPGSMTMPWRNFIAEGRLKALIGLALANNRDLRVAVLNVELARAQYRIQRSASFPEVDGSAGFSRARGDRQTRDEWSASVGTTAYEIDLFGRVRSLNRQALEEYFGTEEARRSAQVSLVAEVATEYFTWREAEALLELSRQTLWTAQGLLNLNQAMFDAGASSELEVSQAKGEVQAAKINVTTYELQKAQAEYSLTLLIGEPLPAGLPAPCPFTGGRLLAKIPAGLPSDLLQRRPDILEAEHGLKAANASIGAARAAFFPSISLTASAGGSSSRLSQLFAVGSRVWSFSPQITVPIFTAGRNRADLDAAKVDMRIEIANYQKVIQEAFREVSDALAGIESYTRQVDEETVLVSTQQASYAIALARYRHGDETYLDVLTAQQSVFSAKQGLIQAQFNELASQISLYQALGGGWK